MGVDQSRHCETSQSVCWSLTVTALCLLEDSAVIDRGPISTQLHYREGDKT